MQLIHKQLPARGMNQMLTQVGTVVAYGCVAVPLLATGQLSGEPFTADALFNIVGRLPDHADVSSVAVIGFGVV